MKKKKTKDRDIAFRSLAERVAHASQILHDIDPIRSDYPLVLTRSP